MSCSPALQRRVRYVVAQVGELDFAFCGELRPGFGAVSVGDVARLRPCGDDEAGRAKLKELTKAGRYQRDVY